MKQALIGYTYQHRVTSLLLSLMDAKRMIDYLEIEVDAEHKFDDVNVLAGSEKYYCQIKDFENISLNDLQLTDGSVKIQGKLHRLSSGHNIIFFKHITIETDSEILGFSSKQFHGVHIVSLSRSQIDGLITELYHTDRWRRNIIDQYLDTKLDKREFSISRKDLPTISFYNTQLTEATVDVTRSILLNERILLIEGKPGIGKSHLVNHLTSNLGNTILYRFWVSNQDVHKHERLKFESFLVDLSKRLFMDFVSRTEEEIIKQLEVLASIVIVDGLDHVENYNSPDLERYILFLDRLKEKTKVIVLSRPLKRCLDWKRQLLENWNFKQTRQVLDELYHLDYGISDHIYTITNGYPILVRYIAEHHKKYGTIPNFEQFDDVNGYYDEILSHEKGKQAFAIFLCTGSFIMRSEIDIFLGKELGAIVQEFIDERPYLFDLRLNRVTLFHDSLMTYLRNTQISYATISENVSSHVYRSLASGEKQFQSRVIHFEFSVDQTRSIVIKYASLENFRAQLEGMIDYEATREFYNHLREMLLQLSPEDLSSIQYYELALILSLLLRDHTSTLNGFNYIYLKSLLKNGYNEEHITSSRYLFGMLYYLKTTDGSYLENLKSDDMYDTQGFMEELEEDLNEQDRFFRPYTRPLSQPEIQGIVQNMEHLHYQHNFAYALSDLYINPEQRDNFSFLYSVIEKYIKGREQLAISELEPIVRKTRHNGYYARWILRDTKKRLLAMGQCGEQNDFVKLSLKEFIEKNRSMGSFNLWRDVLDYLRLSLYQDRQIDIASIAYFWTKYYQRHDYTLNHIAWALAVFEQKGYVDWKDSVKLIREIQEISEKGYRWLLGSYIEEKGAAFLEQLLSEFDYKELKISWFLLRPELLDVLPQEVFYYELGKEMQYHASSQSIESYDLINAIKSNKAWLVKRDLEWAHFKVRISNRDPELDFLKASGMQIDIYEEEFFDEEQESKDLPVPTEPTPSILEVAKEHNSNFSGLASPEKFNQFPDQDIRENIGQIFYHSLTTKPRDFDTFNNTFNLPGSMIKILSDAKVDADYYRLFKSFTMFLELSHFTLGERSAQCSRSG